jgi:hypothetical protein
MESNRPLDRILDKPSAELPSRLRGLGNTLNPVALRATVRCEPLDPM